MKYTENYVHQVGFNYKILSWILTKKKIHNSPPETIIYTDISSKDKLLYLKHSDEQTEIMI